MTWIIGAQRCHTESATLDLIRGVPADLSPGSPARKYVQLFRGCPHFPLFSRNFDMPPVFAVFDDIQNRPKLPALLFLGCVARVDDRKKVVQDFKGLKFSGLTLPDAKTQKITAT